MSKPDFVYVTYIETTPEELWQALTDSSFTRRYWFDTELQSSWKVGSPIALVMGGRITDSGRILEADRPRRLTYTFEHELFEDMRNEPATKVTFAIAPYGGLVKLTVTHEGFIAGSKLLGAVSSGWPAILSALKTLLETGKPLSIPPAAMGIEEFK